jgi:hypothetical protein
MAANHHIIDYLIALNSTNNCVFIRKPRRTFITLARKVKTICYGTITEVKQPLMLIKRLILILN